MYCSLHLDSIVFTFSGLWAVINNAGIAVFAETEWCTMDAYQRVIDVNLMGLIRVTKAFLPLVRRAKGRVVNMSSLAGKMISLFSHYVKSLRHTLYN